MKRAIIILGYKCNNNCLFCSVGDMDKNFERDFPEIVKDLYEKKEKNIDEVEFIGGEALIRRDIIDLVESAKGFGYKKILIETNGRMMSIEKFARDIISAGLNTVSFSLHGHKAEIHDTLSGSEGSFEQCLQGISNAKKYGAEIRINYVVCKLNYKYISKLIELTEKLNPNTLSLSFINPVASALENKQTLIPKLSDVSKYMIKALEKKVEYKLKIFNFPLCILPGFEKNIRVLDSMIDTAMSDGEKMNVSLKDNIRDLKIKPSRCKKCVKKNKCDGLWKGYYEMYSESELKPY